MLDKTHKTAEDWTTEAKLQLQTLLFWLDGGHLEMTPEKSRDALLVLDQIEQQVTLLRQKLQQQQRTTGK